MVKLVIRDDDCNFFTKPDDLEKIYRGISGFPISYAVIPMVTDVLGGCPETKGNTEPKFLGENKEIVDYLKEKAQSSSCDILLHGITHGYQLQNNHQIPEMYWRKNQIDLENEIKKIKNIFENLFDISINIFVAPSNHITRSGIKAVYANKLNFSGIIPIAFERDFTSIAIKNYIKRWGLRCITGLPYPNVLDYGTHMELNAYACIDYDSLVKMFHFCKKIDSPMAINVHYWHIREFPNKYKGFFKFIEYALSHGAVPSRLRDCF